MMMDTVREVRIVEARRTTAVECRIGCLIQLLRESEYLGISFHEVIYRCVNNFTNFKE
jgi:hypothetical protein